MDSSGIRGLCCWIGDLNGACSLHINIQHRLIYQVLDGEQVVKVLRLWSRYE